MYFIRHSRLFLRKGQEEKGVLCTKRSEGRLKRYESCTDNRAWSLDRRERASYILDFMTSLARTEDTLSEGRALGGTSYQRQALPSGYEKEYVSEAIEEVGALHSEGVGVDLQSGNLPLQRIRQGSEEAFHDDISESSLNGRKYSQISALQDDIDGDCGCSNKKELLTSSKENTMYGEDSELSLQHADIKAEKKTDDTVHPKNLHKDETIRGEDENLPLDHDLEDSILDDISEISVHKGKFIRVAALQPNPDNYCGCSPENDLSTFSTEYTIHGDDSGVIPVHGNVKVKNKSDDTDQAKNLYEDETIGGENETIRGEDESLPLDDIMHELLDDISESSVHKAKFTGTAALEPYPNKPCGCSDEKELLTSSKENKFQSGLSPRQGNIKVEKKSDDAAQSKNLYEDETIRGEDETLPSDHDLLEESIPDDISDISVHKGKFIRVAALRPNPKKPCRCSPEKDLSRFSTEYTIHEDSGVFPLHGNIKFKKKSDDTVQPKNLHEDETIGGENETLPLDHYSVEESVLDDISDISVHNGKFIRVAALRPNPNKPCGCNPEKDLSRFSTEYTIHEDSGVSPLHGNTKFKKKSDNTAQPKNLYEDETIRRDDETLPLNHIKQEQVAEQIPDDVSESSVHGEKITQIAALRPNSTQKCVCSAAKELLTSSKVNNFYTLSLQPANIKREKKSDELIPSTKGNTYTVSLQPVYIKSEKKSDETLHTENLTSKKSKAENVTNRLFDHVKQESIAEDILDGVIKSSVQGEKFTQPKQESVAQSILDGIKSPDIERNADRGQMDLQSATCSCKAVKEDSFVAEADMEYHNFLSGSPSSSSKYSVKKEENHFPKENPSVQYVSYSRLATITISETDNEAEVSAQDKKVGQNFHGEQRDPQIASCSCNGKKQPDHIIKTETLSVNAPAPDVNMMTGTVREMMGYNNHTKDDISFDSASGFSKQRFHACREAKQVGTASNEAVEIHDGGMAYYLIPVSQAQRAEFSSSEKEIKSYDSAKQAGHVVKKEGISIDVPALETFAVSASNIKKEEDISLPYGEMNGTDGGNIFVLMNASQYAEEDVSYEKESSSSKQHVCECKEAKKTASLSQEEAEIPACGRVYFLVPVSQVQGTEFNDPGKEGKFYDDKVSSETPVTDVIHFNEHMESHNSSNMNSSQYAEDDFSFDSESDCCKRRFHACREAPVTGAIHYDELDESHHRNGNIHTEMSEKLLRSFDVERKFYKEQMDAAIRKLNDQIKEIENLRTERDSLKTNLDTAQHYLEQHKQAINKLNSMKKVDEQLSRENELLLKKIYQLSHTAFNQQTKISKLKMKLKEKSKLSNYIQNSSSSVKGSGEFQPVHVLYPASQNNFKMPYESVFVESYSQYPVKDSTSNAASRYNNMTGNDRYSFDQINGKRAFVERTVNHVQITSITDHSPQNKKYLDLKKTIRREKDNLLKVTKLIQFQQGVISNLSNCIDNERMLLSELNNARMRRKDL